MKEFTEKMIGEKISTKELADWFGISYGGFRNQKKKYLNKLEFFANFEIVYGGIILKEILIPQYNKILTSSFEYEIARELQYKVQHGNGLFTIDGIRRKKNEEYKIYKDNAKITKYAVNKCVHNLVGKNSKKKKNAGKIGSYTRVWVLKIDDFNNYAYMNKEQEKFFNDLRNNFILDKEQNDEIIDAIQELKDGEITKDECIETFNFWYNNFKTRVLNEFHKRYGYWIVRASQAEVNYNSLEEYYAQYKNKELMSASINRTEEENQKPFKKKE